MLMTPLGQTFHTAIHKAEPGCVKIPKIVGLTKYHSG